MTTARKLLRTDWYAGNVNPVRSGVYERLLPWGSIRPYYFSRRFHCWIIIGSDSASVFQNLNWRGIVKP